jgi:hypothetical protein
MRVAYELSEHVNPYARLNCAKQKIPHMAYGI